MNSIISLGQKVIVHGKETIDPTMIGYAVLDAVENGYELKLVKDDIQTHHVKDMVYLIHDPEQNKRMITSIHIDNENILYEMICGVEVSTHYGFEISKTKNPEML